MKSIKGQNLDRSIALLRKARIWNKKILSLEGTEEEIEYSDKIHDAVDEITELLEYKSSENAICDTEGHEKVYKVIEGELDFDMIVAQRGITL